MLTGSGVGTGVVVGEIGCGREVGEGGADVEAGVAGEHAVRTILRHSPTIRIRPSVFIGTYPFLKHYTPRGRKRFPKLL